MGIDRQDAAGAAFWEYKDCLGDKSSDSGRLIVNLIVDLLRLYASDGSDPAPIWTAVAAQYFGPEFGAR